LSKEPHLQDAEVAVKTKTCLFSFGGHTFPLENINNLQVPSDWKLILVQRHDGTVDETHNDNVILLTHEQLKASNVSYVDLVGAVDVVVCKVCFIFTFQYLRPHL